MNPRLLIGLSALVVCMFAGLLVAAVTRDDESDAAATQTRFEGAQMPAGVMAPDFLLRDQDGAEVSMRGLRGQPVVVTFLYTSCEDTCPTQAQQIKSGLDELGEDVPVLAVAVDPPRDTPDSAKAFLTQQRANGRMNWVLGSRRELEPIWDAFSVRPQLDDLEHTARLVLVDRAGRQRVSYPIGEASPDRLAHDLRLLRRGV